MGELIDLTRLFEIARETREEGEVGDVKDIVEELRSLANDYEYGVDRDSTAATAIRAAADKIEALRERVRLAEATIEWCGPEVVEHYRAAVKGEGE